MHITSHVTRIQRHLNTLLIVPSNIDNNIEITLHVEFVRDLEARVRVVYAQTAE